MKQSTGLTAAMAAIAGSVSTMACCLPLGFAAAAGAASASVFFWKLRPWLLAISVALIALGFWQQRAAKLCALKTRWIGQAFLWAAVVIVIIMTVFPQQIAGFMADHLFR
jgi:hypothetical protein